MKTLRVLLLLLLAGPQLIARDGYQVKVTFNEDISDTFIYLAHYYAKSFPTVYKTDSAEVKNKRTAVFQMKDSMLGGIYLVLFEQKSRTFEFILNNGDKMEIEVDASVEPARLSFKGSKENDLFMEYKAYLTGFGEQQKAVTAQLESARTAADTQEVRAASRQLNEELNAYRKAFIQKHPQSFISKTFQAIMTPETPPGPHYLDDGKTIDSNFAYYYYKNHYWDNFDFSENRIMYTPIYEGKLDEYFNKLVLPVPDSMKAEADTLLAKARAGTELFKYSLHWLANNAERSKIMGMDEVFVHLVENYYMQGDAYWVDSATLARYEEKAQSIAPNVLGNPAPDIKLQDIWNLQDVSLSEVEAEYTLLFFWSPSCGHCLKELPLVDSVYEAALRAKGVKVYSIPTDGELSEIQELVRKESVADWINVVDARNTEKPKFQKNYNAYSTPKLYLLDKDKKIIGKGLDHSNILGVIEWTEKKARL